jgi:tetratricopeptide (TPR) repeat protein
MTTMTPGPAEIPSKSAEPTARPRGEGSGVGHRPQFGWRGPVAGLLALVVVALGGYFGYEQYRLARRVDSVRRLFAARRYDEAREPLRRWLDERPRSAEAHSYRAWLALVDDRPPEVVDAVRRAQDLGFDRSRLEVLQAVYYARGGRIRDAEPILRRAFEQGLEPRAEVARELARIDLARFRLTEAAQVVERYRELMPADPQPYLWSNEIASRSGGTPAILIRNYRAALERDPELDKARLGLAEELSKDRRFDEAEQEYRAYLRRNPKDAAAQVGLGRNAFQMGDIAGATREFEAALAVDPRQADALKELAQLDLRFGRFAAARRRLELLTQIDPFDHKIRYSYAQALKFVGETEKARLEGERAKQLRDEEARIVRLRSKIVDDPHDMASRLEVARWMLSHGHDDEGLKWTKEIFRADPHHSATHQALADYYATHGNPRLANYHRTMASTSRDAR